MTNKKIWEKYDKLMDNDGFDEGFEFARKVGDKELKRLVDMYFKCCEIAYDTQTDLDKQRFYYVDKIEQKMIKDYKPEIYYGINKFIGGEFVRIGTFYEGDYNTLVRNYVSQNLENGIYEIEKIYVNTDDVLYEKIDKIEIKY